MKKKTILLNHNGDDGGGGPEFEAKVLEGVLKIETTLAEQQKKMLGEVDRLDQATKDTLEDITKLQKTANDSQENFNELLRKFAKLDAQVKQDARSSFPSLDPVKRVQKDDNMRLRLRCAMLQACSRNGDFNSQINAQLAKVDKDIADPIRKAISVDASPGTSLVDDDLANELYNLLETYGTWNTFQVVNVGTRQTKFPVQTARASAAWVVTDGGAISEDGGTQTIGQVTCNIENVASMLYASMALLEDSEFDITSIVMNDFAESIAQRLDHACYNADGTADGTHGGQTGIINGGTAANAAAGNSTLETTDFEDWTRVTLTVGAAALQRPSRWWMHPQSLIRALHVRDGNGRPIFLNALEAPSAGAVGTILGYPVTLAAEMPVTNAATSTPVIFGDPAALVVGIGRGFTFESSDDFRFANMQRTFRGHARAGVIIRVATGFGVLTLTA